MKRPEYSKILFLFSCAVILFVYGVAVGAYRVFPYSILVHLKSSLLQVYGEKDMILKTRPTDQLFPARYDGNGVTHFDAGKAKPGLTFLTGFFDNGNEMRLIRLDGTIVNRWPVRFSEIFTDTSHIKPESIIPKSDWNAALQGALALPDGSIVFNFSYFGMVKLDRCGNLVWKLARGTHHSVERAAGGGFWVPGARYVESNSRYPNLQTPYTEDVILKVSDDGEVVNEIFLLDILYKHNLQGLVVRVRKPHAQDLYHLNDVEELGSDIAGSFPQFSAGDLLLSMRYDNLLMVIDPRTSEVKWYQSGPWNEQHDPDFRADGSITVFNNNNDGTQDGSILGGSNIMSIDPLSREVSFLYGEEPGQKLYSLDQGEHQNIGQGSGHLLITETGGGRVVEVSPQGEVVWEYINRYDDQDVALVTGAIRYPDGYFTVEDWSCR